MRAARMLSGVITAVSTKFSRPSRSTGTRIGKASSPAAPRPSCPITGRRWASTSAKLSGSARGELAGRLTFDIRRTTWPSGLASSTVLQPGTSGRMRSTRVSKSLRSPVRNRGDSANAWRMVTERRNSLSMMVAAWRLDSRARCSASCCWWWTSSHSSSPATSARGTIPAKAMASRRLRKGTRHAVRDFVGGMGSSSEGKAHSSLSSSGHWPGLGVRRRPAAYGCRPRQL